jgi:hypothetical protein
MYEQLASLLGRGLNPAETDFVKKLMTDGEISEFEAGQYLSGLPEFQQRLLDNQATALEGRLAGSDEAVLGRAAKVANSQFAGLGRNVTSAQSASVLQAGGDLAQQRQSLLAQFYGQGQQNIQNNYLNRSQSALERAYQNRDSAVAFGRQNFMYDRYKRDYEDQIKTQSRRNLQAGLWGALGQMPGQLAKAYAAGGSGMPAPQQQPQGYEGGWNNKGQMFQNYA